MEQKVLETKLGVDELNKLEDELHKMEDVMFTAFRKCSDIDNDFYGKFVNGEKDKEKRDKLFAVSSVLREVADEVTNLYEKLRVASDELLDMNHILLDRQIENVQNANDEEFENNKYEVDISVQDLKDKLGL